MIGRSSRQGPRTNIDKGGRQCSALEGQHHYPLVIIPHGEVSVSLETVERRRLQPSLCWLSAGVCCAWSGGSLRIGTTPVKRQLPVGRTVTLGPPRLIESEH